MRNRWVQRSAVAACWVFASMSVSGAVATSPRPFTVRDSIELSTFLYPGSQWQVSSEVSFSPDRAHFVVATIRGNLTSGKRDATLWLFDSASVRKYVAGNQPGDFSQAVALVRVSSGSDREPISNWRWSSNSRSVLFLTADDDGIERLNRVDIATQAAVLLSLPDQDVANFDERNGAVVYLAHKPVRASDLYQAGGPTLPDMEVATGKNVIPLLFPEWTTNAFHESEDDLWRVVDGVPQPVLAQATQAPLRLKASILALAPDGQHLVVTSLVKHVPKSWESYKPLVDYPGFSIVADTPETEGATGYMRPKRYDLIDLGSGAISALVDAPIQLLQAQSSATVQWSADGTRVALLGVYPQLDTPVNAAGGRTILPCAIMITHTRTKESSCALSEPIADYEHVKYGERRQLVAVRWKDSDRTVEADYALPNVGHPTVGADFTPSGKQWKAQEFRILPPQDGLSVAVHQALDQPPVLMASIGKRAPRRLLDPNPQLRDIALGTAELYRWHDPDGDEWTGALVKPPGYSPGRRYPLVIQTHDLDRAKFLVDGPSATGFAARALAARDMLVLQMDEIKKNDGNPQESPSGAAGYRAGIQQLVSEGHVDPKKVGIITWSHMGPYAMQGLIDTPQLYAAATFAEAAYNSYGEYLMNIDYMGIEREQMFRAQYGRKPFGEGLADWMSHGAAFRTDRVCAPILFQINSPPALVYGWDSYAAIRAQNKPIDLFYIRGGNHVSVKPLQRLAEQGMNVDWYDYWLNGRRDPDTGKDEQYKRWDAMKGLVRCGGGV